MKKIALVVVLACLVPSLARAQAVSSYTLTIYVAGTTTVVGTPATIPVVSLVCNQAQPAATGTVNPKRVVFDDPANAGQACIYTDTGTGPLTTLPFGAASYEATLHATNSVGSSGESVKSLPFTHPGTVPPVPTGVRVVQ